MQLFHSESKPKVVADINDNDATIIQGESGKEELIIMSNAINERVMKEEGRKERRRSKV